MPDQPIATPADIQPLYNIRAGIVQEDDWQRFVPDGSGALPVSGRWLVTQTLWLEQADELRERHIELGVLIEPADDALLLQGRFDGLALVAVDFPVFTDGRGFSSGYLVRSRLGWTGELRAVGEVLIDTVHYLARCGFDSFTLKPGHDAAHALKQFKAFSVHYQRQYATPAGDQAA